MGKRANKVWPIWHKNELLKLFYIYILIRSKRYFTICNMYLGMHQVLQRKHQQKCEDSLQKHKLTKMSLFDKDKVGKLQNIQTSNHISYLLRRVTKVLTLPTIHRKCILMLLHHNMFTSNLSVIFFFPSTFTTRIIQVDFTWRGFFLFAYLFVFAKSKCSGNIQFVRLCFWFTR